MRTTTLDAKKSQPFCVIAVHDKATDLPVFGATNYGIGTLDSDEVLVQGVRIPLRVTVDELMYREMRPNGLGLGIHRKECTFVLREGGPFSLTPFTPQMYSAGANTDKFYFSLWVGDLTDSLKDLALGFTCLGYFDLDAGLGWDESTLSTTFKLIERMSMLTGRYNNNTEDAESILAGSEWQRLLEAPAYLGYRGKVAAYGRTAAAIGGFDTYNKSVLGVIAGLVQSSTLVGTSIDLGKSPTLAAIVGDTVKLKFGNGCIASGVITDLGGGNFGINTSGMSVGVAWDSVLVYNKGWTGAGDPLNSVTTDLTSIFLDNTEELTAIPSPNMYMRTASTIELYNAGPVTVGPLFCKLTGIKDEANKELSCEELKDPANPNYKFGGVSVEFDAVAQSVAWTDADTIHLNYAMWLGKQTCPLYFSPATFVLADIQKQGMPWELIVTPHVNNTVNLENVYYIRLVGNTTLAESESGKIAIYGNNGSTLLPIPSSEIDSITYSNTDFNMPDLCKIVFKRRLTDINEAFDEGEIYVDTSRAMYAAEILTFILESAGINEVIRANSLRDASNKLGNPMSLMIEDQTWTELLETVLFESGLQINVDRGFYTTVPSFTSSPVTTFNNTADSTQTFMYVNTSAVVSFSDVVDNTYKMDIGRAYTNIDAQGREFVRTHYTYQYPYSYYGGVKLRKLQSIKAVKNNDRKIDYTFQHLIDTNTAIAAAVQMSRLGHVSNIPDTTRTITVGLPLSYINLQVLDSVRMVGFRHVSALNDPLPAYDDASTTNPVYTLGMFGPVGKYTTDVPYMLLPGIGIVDMLEFNFSGSGVPVTLTFKQVQVSTTSNLKSVAEVIVLNTDAENEEGETAGEDNDPGNQYVCPADNETVTKVVISPGEAKPSGVTEADPCCNSTSTDGDVESDQTITVTCTGPGGACHDPEDPACKWPDGCVDNSNIYWEAVTDTEIGSTDALMFTIYSFNAICAILVSVNYPGQQDPDSCVQYTPACIIGNVIIGHLTVNPCVFNVPEELTGKGIELVFLVQACHTDFPNGRTNPGITTWTPKYIHITIPVSLRPVADINAG